MVTSVFFADALSSFHMSIPMWACFAILLFFFSLCGRRFVSCFKMIVDEPLLTWVQCTKVSLISRAQVWYYKQKLDITSTSFLNFCWQAMNLFILIHVTLVLSWRQLFGYVASENSLILPNSCVWMSNLCGPAVSPQWDQDSNLEYLFFFKLIILLPCFLFLSSSSCYSLLFHIHLLPPSSLPSPPPTYFFTSVPSSFQHIISKNTRHLQPKIEEEWFRKIKVTMYW